MLKPKQAKRNASSREVAQRTPCVTPKKHKPKKLTAKAKAPQGFKYKKYHRRAVDIFCSLPSYTVHDVHRILTEEGADVSLRSIVHWSRVYCWEELRSKTQLNKDKIIQKANDILDKPDANSQDVFAASKLLEQMDAVDSNTPTEECPAGDIIVKLSWLIDSYSKKLVKEKNATMVQLQLSIIGNATKLLQQHKDYMTDIITKVSSSYFVIIEEYAQKFNKPLLKEWVESVEDISNMIDSILLEPLK